VTGWLAALVSVPVPVPFRRGRWPNAGILDGFIDALDPQDITISASTGPASVVTPVTARPP
jgi:hypothetical protein